VTVNEWTNPVPPRGEGVNLISTSTELPQASIVQASVHGVFDRPVPDVSAWPLTGRRFIGPCLPFPACALP
jgi:hypothetical protein